MSRRALIFDSDDEGSADDTGIVRRNLFDDDTRPPPPRAPTRNRRSSAAAAAAAIAESPHSIAVKMRSGEINIALTYLESLEFVGEDFSGLDFTDGKLKFSVFRRCTFNNTVFDKTDLMLSKFIDCDISDTNFDNVFLQNAIVNNCRIRDTKFNNSDLNSVKFINDTNFDKVLFSNCKLISNQFLDCIMNEVRFVSDSLSINSCNISSSTLVMVDFSTLTLNKCIIRSVEFDNCNFNDCQIINDSTIIDAEIHNSFFNNATISNAVIETSNFINTELKSTILNDSSIYKSKFIECNFLNAQFISTFVEYSEIKNTDLTSLILRNTSFTGMNFNGSDLPDGIEFAEADDSDEYDEYDDEDYYIEEELAPEVMPSGMTRAQMAESIRARGLSAAAAATSDEVPPARDETSGPKCYDIISQDDINIQEYLSEEPDNFIIGFPTSEGYNYKCQSLTNLKRLNSDPEAERGDDYYKVFYECKDDAPTLVQGSYNNLLLRNGRTFIKIEGTMVLLPPWFRDGPVPEPRVFVLEKREPVFKFVSSSIVPTRPITYSFVGIDHCNQTSRQDTYELVPHAMPSGGKRIMHKRSVHKIKTHKKNIHKRKFKTTRKIKDKQYARMNKIKPNNKFNIKNKTKRAKGNFKNKKTIKLKSKKHHTRRHTKSKK